MKIIKIVSKILRRIQLNKILSLMNVLLKMVTLIKEILTNI